MATTPTPSPTPIPRWVKLLHKIIEWTDTHPIYLLPQRVRFNRYRLWDDACGCEHCEERRKKGMQGPRKYF